MSIKEKIIGNLLDLAQDLNDKLYERDGLSEDVLNNQLKINKYRNEFDISDTEEVVTDDGFVQ